jgi:hypothetical protein
MNGLKQPKVGESYRQLVTLVKIKKGVPTVIRVAGREYILRAEGQFNQQGRRRKRDDRAASD